MYISVYLCVEVYVQMFMVRIMCISVYGVCVRVYGVYSCILVYVAGC